MKTKGTLWDVLQQLASEGFTLGQGYETIILRQEAHAPWYVRIFAGLSAWIAAALFVAFLLYANILQLGWSDLLIGLIFCACAVGLNRLGPDNDFCRQLALALSLVGQIAVAIFLVSALYEIATIALLLILLEVALIWAYDDRVHRFISTLIISGAVLAALVDLRLDKAVHGLILALAAAASLILQRRNHLSLSAKRDLIEPVGYGATVSLLILLILPLIDFFDAQRWAISALLLMGVLLGVEAWIVADLGYRGKSKVVLGLLVGSAVLSIPAARMPGILGALLVLLLGFWRTDRLLMGMAAVFLVFYLGAYYYALELTLLAKSLTLIGSGGVLLALRYVVLRSLRGGVA